MSEEPKKPDDISQEDWDSVDVPEWTEGQRELPPQCGDNPTG